MVIECFSVWRTMTNGWLKNANQRVVNLGWFHIGAACFFFMIRGMNFSLKPNEHVKLMKNIRDVYMNTL